ncbi:adenylate/guanylate cyclase domain-containing protein, partial [Mycobacterium sp. XDR-48]
LFCALSLMFMALRAPMLERMNGLHTDDAPVNWLERRGGRLTSRRRVTLLHAGVEHPMRLWGVQSEAITAAMVLSRKVSAIIAGHCGVRLVDQGVGDGFVAAFAHASDAVACALELHQAPLSPIVLRIGIHTGEAQLVDERIYAGATMNLAAELRDLAHGGQTVMSGATEDAVLGRLPMRAWLIGLRPMEGSPEGHNFPQSQRIAQLCHPNLRNTFPPLRMRIADASGIPYVGRILVNVQVVPHWEGGCAAAGMVLAG